MGDQGALNEEPGVRVGPAGSHTSPGALKRLLPWGQALPPAVGDVVNPLGERCLFW